MQNLKREKTGLTGRGRQMRRQTGLASEQEKTQLDTMRNTTGYDHDQKYVILYSCQHVKLLPHCGFAACGVLIQGRVKSHLSENSCHVVIDTH